MELERLFKILDALEQLEKEQGLLGTMIGILLIAVSTMFTLAGIVILVNFNMSVFNWVINQLWFN